MAGKKNVNSLLKGVRIACIGPVTEQTVKESGLKPDIVAREYTMPGLVKAIAEYFYCKKD
jgi:uroporphyrinogen III methyltransferase/synthase